jgi:hypothetical protein
VSEAEAYEALRAMVAADSDPVLSEVEVERLLLIARRADVDGREITDAAWVPTWDLNAAAAEGWRNKAGKVAGQFSFATDGQTFNRVQMVEQCREMARLYANRVHGSMPMASSVPLTEVVANG